MMWHGQTIENDKQAHKTKVTWHKKTKRVAFWIFYIKWISMSLIKMEIKKILEIQYLAIGKSDWGENFCGWPI